MFKGLDKAKEEGSKTYGTSTIINGMVDVYDEKIIVGGYSLTDFIDQFVDCYGKEVRIEIKVIVKL